MSHNSQIKEKSKYIWKGNMKDNEKTKEVLLNELKKMNQRINDLELSKKKIEKSEEMAYKFLDTIPDLAMLVQVDNWIILALNESMAKSLGKNKKDLIGTNILDVFPSDVAKCRKEQAKKVLQDRKPIHFEDERNGRWFYNTFYPIFDSKGKITHGAIFVHEITEQKKIEQKKLKNQEEYFYHLIQNSSDLISIVEADGTIRYQSPSLERLFGYTPNETAGRNIFEFFHPDQIPRLQKYFKDGIKKPGLAATVEYRLRHKNGSWVHCESTGSNLLGDPSINGIVISTRDVTERKQMENALRKSETLFRNIFDNCPIGIYRTNPDGKILMSNSTLVQMLGYSSFEELAQCDLESKAYHPEYPRINFKRRIEREKQIIGLDSAWNKKDGSTLFIRENAKAVYDIEGNVLYYEGTMEDITEHKHAEKALKESEERYRKLVEFSPEAIVVHRGGKFVYVNPAGIKLVGAENPKDLIGKNIMDFIHPDYREIVQERVQNGYKRKKAPRMEEKFLGLDGQVTDVEVVATPIVYQGESAVQVIIHNITERKKAEQEIIRTKEHLKNVINSASEIIISIDINNKISTWNKTAEIIMGYKQREIIGRSIDSLDIFEDVSGLQDHIKNIYEGHGKPFDRIILRAKNGAKKLLQVSYSIIQGDNEDIFGILLMGKDITQDSEAHGQLLQGNSYLITDAHSDSALNLFTDLTVADYNGLFITRDTLDVIRNVISSIDVKTIVLSQDTIGEFEHVYEPDKLIDRIKEFIENEDKPIILFDRIDYFLTNFSFETVIKAIYRINNIVTQSNAVLLLRLKPSIVNMRQLALIKEELQPLPSQKIGSIELEEYLYNILKFIHDQNQHNVLVSYRKISQEFSISKVTTAKRLNILGERELILIKKHGKTKSIHISEKGKTLLHKRKII